MTLRTGEWWLTAHIEPHHQIWWIPYPLVLCWILLPSLHHGLYKNIIFFILSTVSCFDGNGTRAVTVPRLSCDNILKLSGLEVVLANWMTLVNRTLMTWRPHDVPSVCFTVDKSWNSHDSFQQITPVCHCAGKGLGRIATMSESVFIGILLLMLWRSNTC